MRPNKTGWALVLFFFGGGIFFWITQPDIYIGQIWVAVSVFLGILYASMILRVNRAQALAQTGVRGQAQIMEMTQTGMMVNNQPRVKLKLRVSAAGVPTFEDTRTETVPLIALGQLSTGVPLTVFLQPDKPKAYVIDWSGALAAGGAAAATGATGAPGFDNFTVSTTSSSETIGGGSDAGQAVMDALKQHGIDPSAGTVDLRNVPAARAAVLQALKEHGVDVAHTIAAASPVIPIQATAEPVERMTKLKQLHDAGLISTEEFESNKKRILEGL